MLGSGLGDGLQQADRQHSRQWMAINECGTLLAPCPLLVAGAAADNAGGVVDPRKYVFYVVEQRVLQARYK